MIMVMRAEGSNNIGKGTEGERRGVGKGEGNQNSSEKI
jgi:hypothetical protein